MLVGTGGPSRICQKLKIKGGAGERYKELID